MHAIDIKEERHHVQEDHLVAGNLLHSMSDLGEYTGDDMAERILAAALTTVLLLIGTKQGQGEYEPPHAGDDKGHARAEHRLETERRRAGHDKREADDKGNGRANIAPGIARAGNSIHALVGGNVGKHGIVKRHGRVKADRTHHVDHKERHSAHGHGLRKAQHQARKKEADEELDLVASVICERTQNRHEERHHERGDRLGIGPCGN